MHVTFPENVSAEWRRKLLAPVLSPSALVSSEWRRGCTKFQPVRFALIYLPHYLDPLDTGSCSVSELHLAMAESGQRLAVPDEAFREFWAAPRESAKSTWGSVIIPLWAMAHEHRSFPFIFSVSDQAAGKHQDNVRAELTENELLLKDFPGLAPTKGAGSANSRYRVTTKSGATIMARGVDAGSLGSRSRHKRPDYIVLDDIEPTAENWSVERADERLKVVTDGIIPMGRRAAIVGLGTTTMYGGLCHDVTRAARGQDGARPWVAAERFAPRLMPALLDEGTETERSHWPQQWSTQWLKDYRRDAPRSYARNYQLDPIAAVQVTEDSTGEQRPAWWRPSLFIHVARSPAVRHIISIDVATTKRKTSNETAIAVVGSNAARTKAVVEAVWAGRVSGKELRDRVAALCRRHPSVERVIVEVNQGGDLWEEDILTGLPVPVESYYAHGHKIDRIENLLFNYEEKRVLHAEGLRELETVMLAYPESADDMLDAVGAGVKKVLGG